MALNPMSARSPIRRAKSTASGEEIALTDDVLLFSVRLSMVTLKPTTEEAGASSPVTNTLPVLALEFEFCDDEFDDPQPTSIRLSPSSKANTKNFFIADSDLKVCVKVFSGGAAIFFTAMETRHAPKCRVIKEGLPRADNFHRDGAMYLTFNGLQNNASEVEASYMYIRVSE